MGEKHCPDYRRIRTVEGKINGIGNIKVSYFSVKAKLRKAETL
jgi:hypothetical protein